MLIGKHKMMSIKLTKRQWRIGRNAIIIASPIIIFLWIGLFGTLHVEKANEEPAPPPPPAPAPAAPAPLEPELTAPDTKTSSKESSAKSEKSVKKPTTKTANKSVITNRSLVPQVFWNAWAERSNNLQFEPVNYLKPETSYSLALDLSAVTYGKTFLSEPISPVLSSTISEWLSSGAKSASLTVLVLPDPAYFEAPAEPVRTVRVNLEKLRSLKTLPSSDLDILTLLRNSDDPDFVFARTIFRVTTRSAEGAASIAIAIWDDDRPLDEITIRLCLASDDRSAKNCSTSSYVQSGLQGVDSLRAATEKGKPPDAALHFVELEPNIGIGVFRQAGWRRGEFKTWKLRSSLKYLHDYLKDTMLKEIGEAQYDENRLRKNGAVLYELFFPEDTGQGREARKAFEAFVTSHASASKQFSESAPSIFVRMVPRGPDPMPIVPLGLMTVNIDKKPTFLGFHFRIETPLPVQTYEAVPLCLNRWVVVLPPQAGADPTLVNARQGLSSIIQKWQGKADFKKDFDSFGDYIGDTNAEQESSAVMVVSHHDANRFWFTENDSIVSAAVRRKFKKPSIAILNGCGTGGPGALDFIKRFSEHGVGTVIATNVEVGGEMAADFVVCLADALERNKAVPGFTISKGYFQALRCLRDRKLNTRSKETYGARVLAYSLFGNGSLRLCPPDKATRR
jgi:hypothetical protein